MKKKGCERYMAPNNNGKSSYRPINSIPAECTCQWNPPYTKKFIDGGCTEENLNVMGSGTFYPGKTPDQCNELCIGKYFCTEFVFHKSGIKKDACYLYAGPCTKKADVNTDLYTVSQKENPSRAAYVCTHSQYYSDKLST